MDGGGMDFGTAWTVGYALLGVLGTVLVWGLNNIMKSASDFRKSITESIETMKESHNKLEVKIARDYISVETFRLFETRLVDTIKDLGNKVDTLLSRGNNTPRRRAGEGDQ